MRILLTGFTPFGELTVNPSQLIVEHFMAQERDDLIALVLPTEYDESGARIAAAIRTHKPDAVLSLGVAQSRTGIHLERIAINVDDARIPDNAGKLASGERITPMGEIAYWSTLPLKAMYAAVAARGIPISYSNHAGTYICNHVFYCALFTLGQMEKATPCGFIHVPDLLKTEGETTTGMALDEMIAAVEICLDVLRAELEPEAKITLAALD